MEKKGGEWKWDDEEKRIEYFDGKGMDYKDLIDRAVQGMFSQIRS